MYSFHCATRSTTLHPAQHRWTTFNLVYPHSTRLTAFSLTRPLTLWILVQPRSEPGATPWMIIQPSSTPCILVQSISTPFNTVFTLVQPDSKTFNPVYPRWTPSKTFRIPFILIQPRSTLFILVPSHSTSFILIHTTHDYHPHTLLNTVNPLLIPFKLIISSATNSTFTRRSVGLKYSAMIFVANLETRMFSTLEIPVWFTRY